VNKCISLWQPWATLWVAGVKVHETRHWPTNYRGTLIVHAAKHKDAEIRALCERFPFRDELTKLGYTYDTLPFGAIVGAIDLVDCVEAYTVHGFTTDAERDKAEYLDLAFGKFDFGRFAWKAEFPMMLKEPIPYKGRQGFFEVPGLAQMREEAKRVA
jgi:hypothetical protein